jgi:hypothetical protein
MYGLIAPRFYTAVPSIVQPSADRILDNEAAVDPLGLYSSPIGGDFEAAGPNLAQRQGWTRLTFKAGDKITLIGHPMRDGSKAGSVRYAKDGR